MWKILPDKLLDILRGGGNLQIKRNLSYQSITIYETRI